MWKVIVDYENYHKIDDEDGNTIAHIQPNYNAELELENEDSGDPNLEAIKLIVEKHNHRIAEIERYLAEQDARINEAQIISDRRLELLIEIYETDGVGLTSYILVKIEEELGDDYFNRHTT